MQGRAALFDLTQKAFPYNPFSCGGAKPNFAEFFHHCPVIFNFQLTGIHQHPGPVYTGELLNKADTLEKFAPDCPGRLYLNGDMGRAGRGEKIDCILVGAG